MKFPNDRMPKLSLETLQRMARELELPDIEADNLRILRAMQAAYQRGRFDEASAETQAAAIS